MSSPTNHNSIRIVFDPTNAAVFLQEVRTALSADATAALVLDMSQVTYADPGALETLRGALEEIRQVGREAWLDHVVSDVYKALQLAKLGTLFKRVHRGAGS